MGGPYQKNKLQEGPNIVPGTKYGPGQRIPSGVNYGRELEK